MSAPTLAQAAVFVQSASSTALSGSLGSNVTKGNYLVAAVFYQKNALSTGVTDTLSSAYVKQVAISVDSGNNTRRVEVWFPMTPIAASGAAPTVTLSFVAATTCAMVIMELTGCGNQPTFGILDPGALAFTASFTGGADTTTPSVVMGVGMTSELLIAVVNAAAPTSLTARSGWTSQGSNTFGGVFTTTQPAGSYTASPCTLGASTDSAICVVAIMPQVIQPAWGGDTRPSGLFYLGNPTDVLTPSTSSLYLPSFPCWSLPFSQCAGYAVRYNLSALWPNAGSPPVPNWAFLDEVQALCQQNNKQYSLSINSTGTGNAGAGCPAWLLALCANTFASTVKGTYPAPWDPTYQTYLATFLGQLAARYGSDPNLLYISVAGMGNGFGADMCASTTDNATLLGTTYNGQTGTYLWAQACAQILALYVTAFPNLPLIYTFGGTLKGINASFWFSYFQALNVMGYQLGLSDNSLEPTYNIVTAAPANIAAVASTNPVRFQEVGPQKSPLGMQNEIALAQIVTGRAPLIEIYRQGFALGVSTSYTGGPGFGDNALTFLGRNRK